MAQTIVSNRIGLVIVHGIGDPPPGEALQELTDGMEAEGIAAFDATVLERRLTDVRASGDRLKFFPVHLRTGVLKGAAPEPVKARKEVHLNGPKDFGESDGVINHIRNFIESVRGNEKVIAPPSVGQQAAISGHMATLSLKSNKKVYWDAKTEKVHYS